MLRYALYFADHSTSWNGAIAFVKRAASDAHTYGRMYLISYGQFNAAVRQENSRNVPGDIIVPPYENLDGQDQWPVNGVRLYGRIIKTGTHDGHPILTLTGDNPVVGQPSEAYIKTIVAGLEETYPCLRKSEIIDYLGRTEGIRGVIQGDVLARWILDR